MPDSSALRDMLTAYTPADDLEGQYRQRMLELTHAQGDPFSRNHFNPGHFTASAFVLSPDGKDMLLILHGKLGLWLQPGGHVDPDDSDIFAAARREVQEETAMTALEWPQGTPAIFDVDIHTIPARKNDPDHEHFDVRVLFKATTRDFTAGDDAKDGRWVPLDEISLEISDESVMRAVRKIQASQS